MNDENFLKNARFIIMFIILLIKLFIIKWGLFLTCTSAMLVVQHKRMFYQFYCEHQPTWVRGIMCCVPTIWLQVKNYPFDWLSLLKCLVHKNELLKSNLKFAGQEYRVCWAHQVTSKVLDNLIRADLSTRPGYRKSDFRRFLHILLHMIDFMSNYKLILCIITFL